MIGFFQKQIICFGQVEHAGHICQGRLKEEMAGQGFPIEISIGLQNSTKRPAIQLKVKTLLNQIQHFPGFVYHDIRMGQDVDHRPTLKVKVRAHRSIRGRCSRCHQTCAGYDQLPQRDWLFVPLWGINTHFVYTPRRVRCPEHGAVVEDIPWSDGKSRVTRSMKIFMARWARRLSWKDTARMFGTSWEMVYRSVYWFVQWGLKHRELDQVQSLGVDEIHWGKGKRAENFLTVLYQLDEGSRRLLWVGRRRTQKTLRRGLDALGSEVVKGLKFVCSDMWKAYLNVISKEAPQALHVLDRFHITMNLNKAVDEVRRGESRLLKDKPKAQKIKKMRWHLLKRGSRLRGKARNKIKTLINSKLATGRAWMLKESFQHFWTYKSLTWATAFLDYWCERAMRSRLEPMKKVARMFRRHEELILNWFKAKGEISSGTVEGLNNKIRVVTRRSYGFRTFKAMETALYHSLGRLPEPPSTHRFC